MKRKFLSVLLAVSLVLSLAGCSKGKDASTVNKSDTSNSGTSDSSGGQSDSSSEGQADSSSEGQTADTSEPYNIIMQVVTWGQTPTEINQVEEAINKITEPEIGVTVTLHAVAAWDLVTESNLSLTSGEKLDLLCIFPFGAGMDSIANYTTKNMIRPLDDLYAQYGKDIAPVLGDLIKVGKLGDTLYAIPNNTPMGADTSFLARTDILKELGITIDPNKKYTKDELEAFFAAYKEKYPNNYCLAVFGSGTDVFPFFNEVDTLGGNGSNGVIIGGGLDGSTKVEDLYESDAYAAYCNQMYGWYQKGYINPDVATITDDVTSLMASGSYFGSIGYNTPGASVPMMVNTGFDMTNIKLVDAYASTATSQQALWAIPNTCENPEKTMQFLNLLYQDREFSKDIDAILTAGVEGVSYSVKEQVSGSQAILDYGKSDAGYVWANMVPAIYGNTFTVPQFAPLTADIFGQKEALNQKIVDSGRIPATYGYVFNPEEVSSQSAAVAAVISQYQALLGFGTIDPAKALPEFIKALKDAGIDEIIAANQKQLDEWLQKK